MITPYFIGRSLLLQRPRNTSPHKVLRRRKSFRRPATVPRPCNLSRTMRLPRPRDLGDTNHPLPRDVAPTPPPPPPRSAALQRHRPGRAAKTGCRTLGSGIEKINILLRVWTSKIQTYARKAFGDRTCR